jgi:UDP-N-acetylglucosamine 1-carboxyvinyltransferase
MAEILEIVGGRPLKGSVRVSGAKNGALPILMSALLATEPVTFKNVPKIVDIPIQLTLLEQLGARVERIGSDVRVYTPRLAATEASYSLVRAIRGSFWVLAPLLARGGAARVALPGGDVIGARPVDMHLEALALMGADITVKGGVVHATAPNGKLHAADINLRFPSVGATHQVLMAASITPGVTILRGAACEPEVVALADALMVLGAEIEGAGTSEVLIRGKEMLSGGTIHILGDRIEAGTYLLAGVATRGEVTVHGIKPSYLGALLRLITEMGAVVTTTEDSVTVSAIGKKITGIRATTEPFPGLATDLQAPLMAALATAEGESYLEETIFEGRLGHSAELNRMGAHISVDGRVAHIIGVPSLSAAPVEAADIRAAAALVIGGLCAQGTTRMSEAHHIRRGYERLEDKLVSLGGSLSSKNDEGEDFIFAGC